MTLTDSSWRTRASCLGKDTAWWFPDRGDFATFVKALAICKACPVRTECRDDADAQRVRVGIRGGVSMDRASRLRRRPTWTHGTRAGYQAGCPCQECREANNAKPRRSRAG